MCNLSAPGLFVELTSRLPLVGFPNPPAPDIQMHVLWGARLAPFSFRALLELSGLKYLIQVGAHLSKTFGQVPNI